MSSIAQALTFRWPGKKWATHGPDYADIEWFDPSPKPTEAEVTQAWLDFDTLPPPPDPSDELMTAISDAIKDEAPNSPVRKLGEALLGQAGKAGRIAGRPV